MKFQFIKKRLDQFSGHKRYYLNACGDSGGPNIFGKRLRMGLKRFGWIYDPKVFDYNLTFISGEYYPDKVNLLRLDGLYFDLENTIGDNEKLNSPIKQAYHDFDKLVFQSQFSLDMFRQHFGKTKKPYKIIYNGVPESFSPVGGEYKYPFDKTLICSAQWRAHKRLEAIIAGFNELKTSNAGLAVLGECSQKIEQENVVYLGKVPPHQLPSYLRGGNGFIHLSWLDWCPNTVVEALACGLPVLCGHNGGTKELVKESGIILDLEEPYNLEKVTLYKPPMPDPKLVARGMEELLEWNRPILRPDLYIEGVARQYIDFILEPNN